jgi:hypothetical protein
MGGGGGGGGGGAAGAPLPPGVLVGIGGGGGRGAASPLESPVIRTSGLVSSMALRGRGGAMVPKSMEASWRVLGPERPTSSSSSSEESSDPTTDHSSSSRRARLGLIPERSVGGIDSDVLMDLVLRWKGFVETSVDDGGEVISGGIDASSCDLTIFRNGFLVSVPEELFGIGGAAGGLMGIEDSWGIGGGGGGATIGGETASLDNSWLVLGVVL